MTKANQIFYFLILQKFSTEHNEAQSGGMGNRGAGRGKLGVRQKDRK